jgi:hypothetical protein
MTQDNELDSNQDLRLKEESNNQNNQVELKPGEYMLTYLHVLFLNKKLPPGYKLELEESYIKTAEQSYNYVGKKRKSVVSLYYLYSYLSVFTLDNY